MSSNNGAVRKEERRKLAAERSSAWSALSVKEQLQQLDKRLGQGVGAQRQRARLRAQLAASKKGEARSK